MSILTPLSAPARDETHVGISEEAEYRITVARHLTMTLSFLCDHPEKPVTLHPEALSSVFFLIHDLLDIPVSHFFAGKENV